MNYDFVQFRLDASMKILDRHGTDLLFLADDNKWLPPKVGERIRKAENLMCEAYALLQTAAHVLESMKIVNPDEPDPGLPHDFGQMCECPDCMEVN